MRTYPHGKCECVTGHVYPRCTCNEDNPGPAAFMVTRKGRGRIRVCTWCDLSEDTDNELLVQLSDDLNMYKEYDRLGWAAIMARLGNEVAESELREITESELRETIVDTLEGPR